MRRGAPKIWWEQEGISDADMGRLALVPKADWVVSHTAPNAFDVAGNMGRVWGGDGHFFAPSRGKLEQVFLKYHPTRWFFGHFHHFMKGRTDSCDWECLSDIGGGEKFFEKIYLEWSD